MFDLFSITRDARKAINPYRACTVGAFVVVSIMFIVVFATRDTTTDQELFSKISELSYEISELSSEMSVLSSELSRYINRKPVVKFEATRDSKETVRYARICINYVYQGI